jgi:hypothetical protein
MLDSFLQGGGSNADIHTVQYQHDLFQLRQELDTALVKIGRMDLNAKNKYMITNGLTYREICSKAEEEWKKLFDDGKWAPAKTKRDPRRLPAGFGTNLLVQQAWALGLRMPRQEQQPSFPSKWTRKDIMEEHGAG